jgi:predicted AAA+ superfamily ATPase
MSEPASSLLRLIARAEAVLARIEAALPHATGAPDWNASTAFRYRKRRGSGALGAPPTTCCSPVRAAPARVRSSRPA